MPSVLACVLVPLVSLHAQTQRRPLDPPIPSAPETPQHRARLILKDRSYQMVLSYKVQGDLVRYRSAERDGQQEEIPLSLVDLPATEAWARAHSEGAAAAQGAAQPPVLSPELAREEAARAARTPEVAPDLRLPEDNSVLVLDTFQGTPELVPLPQYGSELNKETAHSVEKRELNPAASPHDLLLLKEERADVQVHVPDPVFYVRLRQNGGAEDASAGAFVVDTGGQAGRVVSEGGSGRSEYVLEHIDVRQGARALSSLRLNLLGTGRAQANVTEVRAEVLPGGFWLKLLPAQPLEFGEYALVEILNDRAVNLHVWDFGVHPTAKENDEAMRPVPKRPVQLERRGR